MSALERAAVLLLSALGLALIALSAMDSAKRVEAPFRGFAAMEGPLVTPFSSPAWSGERAGLKPLDIVEKADGRKVASLAELDALVVGKQPGDAIEYEVQRFGAGKETVRVPVMTLSAGDLWGYLFPIALTGIAYIAIGLIVYFFKPGTAIGRLFFVSSAFLGFTTALDFEFATVGNLSRLWMITGPIAIATGTLLLFHYPEKSRWLERFPWLSQIAPLPPLLFALGFQTQLHHPQRMIFLIGGYSFYTTGVLLLGGLLVWDTYRRSVSPLVRMRVRILGVPFVVLAPFAVLAAAAALLADLWLSVHYVAVLSVLYPAFMAYGLTQYNLFEVASFVRRAVGYSVATTAVLLSFSVLLLLTQAGARLILGHEAAEETPILSALATVLLFLPLWRSSQGLVDRLFYRERADLQKILARASETLVRSFDAPETAKVCALAIQKALSPEFLAVFLRSEDGNWWPVFQEGEIPPAMAETRIDDDHPLVAVLSKERRPLLLAELEEEKPESPEHLPAVRELKNWGAQIVLPVGRPEQLQGLVLLGPQKSGGSYGPSVLEFLGLLANQASVSLENARLLEAERTRERIIQQESLAAVAQLVDGTAHELNNPLGSAHSLVGTAIESIDEARTNPQGGGLALEEARQALLFAQDQHGRARQIIQTLRQLSELSAQPREAIPLAKILEDAVRAIRLKHSALPFEGDLLVPPEMALFPGSFAQISQMFLHVLDNAVRSLGGAQGKIKATLTDENGEVVFRCEDTGCGIAPEHIKNVFRPFYSGWRPQRDCRGLGLYVCHEIAKTHGGRIDIESTVGKGTTITVRLPRG